MCERRQSGGGGGGSCHRIVLTRCRGRRRRLEGHCRSPPRDVEDNVAHQPLRSVDRADHGPDVGAGRRWWGVAWCRHLVLLTLLAWRWVRELERCHHVTQIGDSPLQIEAPCDEIVDFGCRRLNLRGCLGVGLQGGIQAIQEGFDGWIHGDQLRSRLAQALRFDKLSQSVAGKGGGLISDTR